MSNTDKIKQLNLLFGSYRAEWLKGRIYDFFAEPSYFLALQDNRPFVLEGGRGTGKTTVLRGLSYEGQYALHDKDIDKFDSESKFIGIYHRVDTNHVRAFTDGGLSDKKWIKIFAHYFNLIICRDILLFIKWHNKIKPHDILFTSHQCKLIAQSLHIKDSIEDFTSLVEALDIAMYAFQASINNIGDDTIPLLSMAGDPIKLVTSFAVTLPQFTGKMFFILLDEYENYTDYQQQVINTLIKHSTNDYTFKIGVRELGWRIKHTLNKFEMLHDPADYVRINIENKLTEESHFSEFAKNVCQQRLELLSDTEGKEAFSIENSLANLTIEEEAEVLGITNTLYWNEIQLLPQEKLDQIKDLSKLYKFFLAYWSKIHNSSLIDAIDDYSNNSNIWDTRYENYKYDLLFKIKKGRGKGGIQKYYSGWNTFIKLSSGNIRCLMELVYRTYEKHLSANAINQTVSPKIQTEAAQDIGKKNLMELEGLWERGAQLTKLLLGLGRVFQVLAQDEGKHSPEINQFSLENSADSQPETKELLSAAVMNLALARIHGNKLDKTNTRDYIYSIRPIYAPYFLYSYRKKRKLNLFEDELWGLIKEPKSFINQLLKKRNSTNIEYTELPEQLDMFEEFYNG